MNNALLFLLQIAHWFVSLIFLSRLILQWLGANDNNPLAQAVLNLTEPVLRPLKFFLPVINHFNLAALFVLFVTQVLYNLAKMILISESYGLVVLSSLSLIKFVLDFYFWCIIINAVFSFLPNTNYHPLAQLTHQITRPLLTPIRRLVPPLSGIDFSPLIVLAVIQVIGIMFFGRF